MATAPRISIVTPSFNQNRFVAEAIDSVLDQGYPELEYVIMDGGSTDGSADTIRRYADRLAHWQSEPDGGMYEALNEGFRRTTGDVMGWLNCDDMFFPWTLSIVGEIFREFPEIDWLTSRLFTSLDMTGRVVDTRWVCGYSQEGFRRGEHFPIGAGWFTTSSIPTEATFWRRSLWERSGGHINREYECSGDWELFARFNQHALLYGVGLPLAGQRKYSEQKSVLIEPKCIEEAQKIIERHGLRPRGPRWSRWCTRFALYLPPGLARMTGAVHPTQTVAFRDGAWQIVRDYSGLVR